jgi:HEXXH motif-containing protein
VLIEAMPEVLTWRARQDTLVEVRSAYLTTLRRALEGAVTRLESREPSAAAALLSAFGRLPESSKSRVLLAPETSTRLLWPPRRDEESSAFLLAAAQAEAMYAGDARVALEAGTWTALGDAVIQPDGTIEAFERVHGLPPLDFGSPHALKVDLSGADREPPPPRASLEGGELQLVHQRLADAASGIRLTAQDVTDFVCGFNTVLILQPDPEVPTSFSSGSNGRYIGRSFLANPQASGVGPAILADAIVHEGIHGLLYMQEYHRAWIYDSRGLTRDARVKSPWSGRPLPLPPFLQACFVWYGLLHFWALALEAGAFEREEVHRHLGRALRGFLGAPLITLVQPWSEFIGDDLLSAIEKMQEAVRTAFLAVA